MITPEFLKARRRMISKRMAVRRLKETWKRKQANGTATRKRRGVVDAEVDVDLPGEDVLDELPDSLIG